jgi:hypothetical protein
MNESKGISLSRFLGLFAFLTSIAYNDTGSLSLRISLFTNNIYLVS